jgi:uncharacterized membrane protein
MMAPTADLSPPSAPVPATPDAGIGAAVWVGALTVLALALRLVGVGHESIWYDEAASLYFASFPAWDIFTFAGQAADGGNPMGYYLLLHFWQQLFGSSIEAARAFSAVTGALAVPAAWALARAAGMSRRAGLLGCLLIAVSPPLVYLGQEARTFALFGTVAVLALTASARIQAGAGLGAWVGFGLSGAVLVHLHYYAFFVLFVLGLDLLLWAWPRGWREVARLVVTSACVAAAFAPWLGVFLWQLRSGASRSTHSWWQHLALMPTYSLAGRTLVWKEGIGWLIGVNALALALVFVPAAWLLVRARNWPRPALALALGLPVVVGLVSLKMPMVHSHYLSVAFPAVLVLLGCALDAGLQQRSWLVALVVVGLVSLLAPSLARVYLVQHKTDWRGLAAVASSNPGLPIYCFEDLARDPLAYYLPERNYRQITVPFGTDGSGWQDGAKVPLLSETESFWFVLYATAPLTQEEVPGIRAWLKRHFNVEAEYESATGPAPTVLFRCRPRQ